MLRASASVYRTFPNCPGSMYPLTSLPVHWVCWSLCNTSHSHLPNTLGKNLRNPFAILACYHSKSVSQQTSDAIVHIIFHSRKQATWCNAANRCIGVQTSLSELTCQHPASQVFNKIYEVLVPPGRRYPHSHVGCRKQEFYLSLTLNEYVYLNLLLIIIILFI